MSKQAQTPKTLVSSSLTNFYDRPEIKFNIKLNSTPPDKRQATKKTTFQRQKSGDIRAISWNAEVYITFFRSNSVQ